MDCPQCKSTYNHTDRIPRLLVQCGHSLCDSCSLNLFSNFTISCPECKTQNYGSSLASFPKNLALLLIGEGGRRPAGKKDEGWCQRHQKKMEAFCQKERVLVCIDCILNDGHRNHDVNSLQIAAEKEKELLNQVFSACSHIQSKISLFLTEISSLHSSLSLSAQKSREEIALFFGELRKNIDEREHLLKMKIEETLQSETGALKIKETQLLTQMDAISIFFADFERSRNQVGIELLQGCSEREEIIGKATQMIERVEGIVPFIPLNKENELAALLKGINGLKSGGTSKDGGKTGVKAAVLKREIPQIPTGNTISFNAKKKVKDTKRKDGKEIKYEQKQEVKIGNNINNNNPSFIKKEASPIKVNMNLGEKMKTKNDDGKIFKKNASELQIDAGISDSREKSPLKQISSKQILNYREIRDAYKEQSHNNEDRSHSTTPRKSPYPSAIKSLEIQDPPKKQPINYQSIEDNKSSYFYFEKESIMSGTKGSIRESNVFGGTVGRMQDRLDFSLLCQQFTNFIYVMGGFFDSPSTVVERFDLQKNQWEEIDNLPTNRAKFGVVSLPSGNFIILGGKQDGLRVASIDEFFPKEKKWKNSELKLSSPKSGFGAVTKYDEVLVIGGNDGNSILNAFEAYNLKEKRVKKMPTMIHNRDELAVAVGPDQKIYAIGGFGGPNNCCLCSVERFDPEKNEWELIASLNTPRRALAAVTLPDGIYAIGGFDGFNYLNSVEKYDDSLNEWVPISSMSTARCTLSAVASPDFQNIYVLGGFDNVPLNSVEKYSALTDSWETLPPMKHKRFMHCAVVSSI